MYERDCELLCEVSAYFYECGCVQKELLSALMSRRGTGILHLLQWLERWQELEPICLVAMGSESRVLVPFDTDHKKLRTALYDLEIQDSSSVINGLLTAAGLLNERFGTCANGCQARPKLQHGAEGVQRNQIFAIHPH